MRQELESALAVARSLAPNELVRFLVELREVELTALARLGAPPVATPREDGPELLDVGQAAAHICMSQKWIYRNLAVLPCVRIGNGRRPRIKFRWRDLDLWLEQHAIRQKPH